MTELAFRVPPVSVLIPLAFLIAYIVVILLLVRAMVKRRKAEGGDGNAAANWKWGKKCPACNSYVRTRPLKALIVLMVLFLLYNTGSLVYQEGRMTQQAMDAADRAWEIAMRLDAVDRVGSYATYRDLNEDVDRAVWYADMWSCGLLWLPETRAEYDRKLAWVAKWRREHPRWQPTVEELAQAMEDRRAKEAGHELSIHDRAHFAVGVPSDYDMKAARDADAILARYPAPPAEKHE